MENILKKDNLKNKTDCCINNDKTQDRISKQDSGFLSGLLYGLIPHTGCIAFIIFSIIGVTTATAFFRPLLMNRYFFHALLALSFVFATISAWVYLRKHDMLSKQGITQKWGYLSVLYGTTIGINLLLFLVIFPITANLTTTAPTGAVIKDSSEITLEVDIPCPGHAPLISGELKTIKGVNSIKFRFPDYFDVRYDSSKTSQEELLSLRVFKSYPAKIISGEEEGIPAQARSPRGCSQCSSCSGACGGLCSI